MPNVEQPNLYGRNGEIWRLTYSGYNQVAIGKMFGISSARVGQILKQIREEIPAPVKADIVKEEVDLLRDLRTKLVSIIDAKGAPVTAGQLGEIVRDPESQEIVRDQTARLNAARVLLSTSDRLSRMLGLDEAQKLDVNGSALLAAQKAAEEAVSRLADEE